MGLGWFQERSDRRRAPLRMEGHEVRNACEPSYGEANDGGVKTSPTGLSQIRRALDRILRRELRKS